MILRKTIIIINFGRPALRRQFDDNENIHHETENGYQLRKMSTNMKVSIKNNHTV